MKSCIEWRKSFKYLPQIDEFNIDYKNKEVKLIQFLDQYAISQKVNIRLPNNITENDIELLKAIYDLGKYNIALTFWRNDGAASHIIGSDIPYYFCDLAYSWEDFEKFISEGVTEVFVSGDLAFDLERVKKIADKKEVKLRGYLNVVQTRYSLPENDLGFKHFFIRPEDIDFYSKFFDVFELYDSIDQQNVLYQVYFHDKEWTGNLQEIIKGLRFKVNNYYILGTEFARRRSQCNRRCEKGFNCHLCDRLIELADSLENSPYYEVFRRKE